MAWLTLGRPISHQPLLSLPPALMAALHTKESHEEVQKRVREKESQAWEQWGDPNTQMTHKLFVGWGLSRREAKSSRGRGTRVADNAWQGPKTTCYSKMKKRKKGGIQSDPRPSEKPHLRYSQGRSPNPPDVQLTWYWCVWWWSYHKSGFPKIPAILMAHKRRKTINNCRQEGQTNDNAAVNDRTLISLCLMTDPGPNRGFLSLSHLFHAWSPGLRRLHHFLSKEPLSPPPYHHPLSHPFAPWHRCLETGHKPG